MITVELFGNIDSREVMLYTLHSGNYTATVSEFGCTLVSFICPDARNVPTDIVLGYDSLANYTVPCGNMGASVGRYANRIAGGRFVLDGKQYRLAKNNGPNHLHGGNVGFDKKLWRGAVCGDTLAMDYVSPDGEEGYPGTLCVTICFTLSESGALAIGYTATTDAPTVLNLTNHSYFNLAGGGSALGHVVQIFADEYLKSNSDALATGEISRVDGTAFDLRSGALVGERLSLGCAELEMAHGYDHCYIISGGGDGNLTRAARIICPESGIALLCETTQPGVQLYTANWLGECPAASDGVHYRGYDGICLETQHFPDSPNHSEFPTTELRPGEVFSSRTVYSLSTI